jgi:hypothetical protein
LLKAGDSNVFTATSRKIGCIRSFIGYTVDEKVRASMSAIVLSRFMRSSSVLSILDEDVDVATTSALSEPASPKEPLFARIKIALGIRTDSGLTTLSLEQPEKFFTNDEIDFLIELENVVPLKTKDVPNWDIMFFKKRRVKKPIR